MTRRLLPHALILVLAFALGSSAAGADTELVAADRTFFPRNVGTNCGAGSTNVLAMTAGSEDQNCGYIGGAPFGEVFHAAGEGSLAARVYEATEGVPVLLDATRDITGTLVVSAYTSANGAGVGGGQVIVDLALDGATEDGELVSLGAETLEQLVAPGSDRQVAFPFTLAIDDAFEKAELVSLSLSATVRGAHVAHGFQTGNGASKFTLPIYVPKVD